MRDRLYIEQIRNTGDDSIFRSVPSSVTSFSDEYAVDFSA